MSAAVGGWAGVTLGGYLADRLREKHVLGKLYVGMASVILSVPLGLLLLTTDNLIIAYVANFFFSVTSPMWVGPAAATINDMVMPRMRAISSAFYLLMVTFIGLALGPYTIGQISDTLSSTGLSSAESLRTGMISGLMVYGIAITFLILAARYLLIDESSRIARATELGEEVGTTHTSP